MKNLKVWAIGMVVIAMLAGCGSGGGGASSAGSAQSQAATVASGQSGNYTASFTLSNSLPVSPANVRGISFRFAVPEGVEPIIDSGGYAYGGRVQVAQSSIALVIGTVQGVVAASYDQATREVEVALVDGSGFTSFGSAFVKIQLQVSAPDAAGQSVILGAPAVEEVVDETGSSYPAGAFSVTQTGAFN
ncbi:hypothetical protein L4X63_13555 [Geomonas sp. Red32]|uniref:hypothetical protein n=1 Tax=Geomonas sp. Red32 TaxID=2912856 RepID=UPI00202CE3BA|nr:hypothetical protein [Geomonas sp. Red32]MCM0082621.1 hypothetical protein [Geomonas sp. Red32]